MHDWSKCFEIVYDNFLRMNAKEGVSRRALAAYLGISQGKLQKWEKGQWPNAQDLAMLADRFGFSYRWLITGEGPVKEDDKGTGQPAEAELAILDRLADVLHDVGWTDDQVAQALGISAAELAMYLDKKSTPPARVLAALINLFHINANFVLAQIGKPYLTKAQYEEDGPRSWGRNHGTVQAVFNPATDSQAAADHPEWFMDEHLRYSPALQQLEAKLRQLQLSEETIARELLKAMEKQAAAVIYDDIATAQNEG